MTLTLPPELQAYVDRQVQAGKFASADAAVAEAVQRMKAREEMIDGLRREVQVGIDELDRGEGAEWDVEELKSMLREKYGSV